MIKRGRLILPAAQNMIEAARFAPRRVIPTKPTAMIEGSVQVEISM